MPSTLLTAHFPSASLADKRIRSYRGRESSRSSAGLGEKMVETSAKTRYPDHDAKGGTEDMAVSRRWGVFLLAALVTPAPSAGQQTCVDRDRLHRFDGDDLVWSDVRAVSANDSLLVVLTGSYPAIHLIELAECDHLRRWGRIGEGLGEFQSATGVALVGRHIFALGADQVRLAIFEFKGDLLRTVSLRDFGMSSYRPSRLELAEGDTLLFEGLVPTPNERIHPRAVVRGWCRRGFGSPGLGDRLPRADGQLASHGTGGAEPHSFAFLHSPVPQWTPYSGGLAFWDGFGSGVRVLGFDGEQGSVVPVALDDRFEVTDHGGSGGE